LSRGEREERYKRIIPLPRISKADLEEFDDFVSQRTSFALIQGDIQMIRSVICIFWIAAGDEIVFKHEASYVELTGRDMGRLAPGTWLNDEIINLYLRLLQERDTRLHDGQVRNFTSKKHDAWVITEIVTFDAAQRLSKMSFFQLFLFIQAIQGQKSV